MKTLKYILSFILITITIMSFSQCTTTKHISNKAPLLIKEAYYKTWSNPARFTGSGINLYIIVENNKAIQLDSVYFQNKVTQLKLTDNTYKATLKTENNKPLDVVMSAKPMAEYGNTLPKTSTKESFPFNLKANECIVSYKKGNKTKYFKIIVNKRQTNSSLNQRM
ncbi:hypothetical protein FUA26_04340 [Seonamhaeicola algicola]|uniref:Lipoprotein n=1 Tax=Seonamhaeicola algicola TaxID=1719036 RepID=A0A5C7AWF6_9FLAO|nr:hypothetical protein [Seonamhaeicola algicola]TXE13030.1 hypothetical protein FUA26_04340 [Seonamhaeicola algicola]